MPDSVSTAARVFSTVRPLLRNPFFDPVSSATKPSSTCSVVTCEQRINDTVYRKRVPGPHAWPRQRQLHTSNAPKFLASCCAIITLFMLRSLNLSNTALHRTVARLPDAAGRCAWLRKAGKLPICCLRHPAQLLWLRCCGKAESYARATGKHLDRCLGCVVTQGTLPKPPNNKDVMLCTARPQLCTSGWSFVFNSLGPAVEYVY